MTLKPLRPLLDAIAEIMVREAGETAMRDYTPEETAAYDAAFEAGIREATVRGTGLIMMEATLRGRTAWTVAYPPAGLDPAGVLTWALDTGIVLAEGARYLPTSEVIRAARDMGL